MKVTDFEQRRNRILEAIIEAYISTGLPIGSELISRKMRQSVSPATIRNIMVTLDREGLIEQPHTSAGRVPTDRGYRYYVDSLMDTVSLSPEELQRLADRAKPDEPNLQQLLERIGALLAQLSHQAAFIVAPTVKHGTIKQIDFLPLGARKLICVLVSQEALVASIVVEIGEPISRDEALSLAHFLNTELTGLSTRELLASLERRLLAVSDSFYHVVKRSFTILQAALASEPEEQLFIEGATYLFEQPEFRKDPEKAGILLRCLEAHEPLLARLREDLSTTHPMPPGAGEREAGKGPEGTRVRIGREVALDGMEDCSYLMTPVCFQQSVIGGVGILGPRRMDYRRMRGLTEGMAGLATDILSQWEQME